MRKKRREKRAKENYILNKDKKLLYAKKYRTENKQEIKSNRPKYKKKQRAELQNCYVRELLVTKNGISKELITENPEMIETKRLQLKIKRKIKSFSHAKK